MARALLLFDIDGTILRTRGAGMRAMKRVAGRLFGEHWKWDGIAPGGHLDTLIFAEAAALNGLDPDPAHHDQFRDQYVRELAAELDAPGMVVAMPGMHEVLALVRQREKERGDVAVGMLTGNYAAAVPVKLAAVGIDPAWFGITAFSEDAPTRSDLVALAMKKYQDAFGEPIAPGNVVVIGDTARDVHCAHAHGCIAFTVTTGGVSAQALREAGANYVVPDLSDPTPLLELVDRITSR